MDVQDDTQRNGGEKWKSSLRFQYIPTEARGTLLQTEAGSR